MSVNQFVAISREKLPSVADWENAVKKIGFDVRIDPVDIASHTGYLPVQFLDQSTGFELYVIGTQEIEGIEIDLARHDLVVQLTTFSDELEGQCAMVCAAGLIACCDGIYFDEDAQVFHDASELLGIAKEWIAGS